MLRDDHLANNLNLERLSHEKFSEQDCLFAEKI